MSNVPHRVQCSAASDCVIVRHINRSWEECKDSTFRFVCMFVDARNSTTIPYLRFRFLYIYKTVLTCRQHIINSSASAPPNATKIAVKKVSDVDVCMFGPEL